MSARALAARPLLLPRTEPWGTFGNMAYCKMAFWLTRRKPVPIGYDTLLSANHAL